MFFVPAWKKPEYYLKTLKTPVIDWSIRVLVLDSPRPVKKHWSSHPLSLVMEDSMISNIHSLPRYCERHSWGRYIYIYLDQSVPYIMCTSSYMWQGHDVLPRMRYPARHHIIGKACRWWQLCFDDCMWFSIRGARDTWKKRAKRAVRQISRTNVRQRLSIFDVFAGQ